MKFYIFVWSFILTAVLLGCARSFNPDINRGSTYDYKRGYPDVRFSAIGSLDEENNSFINIAADIVYGSVYYKREGKKRKANLAIELRIINKENDDVVIKSDRFSYDQLVEPSLTTSQEIFTFNQNIIVKPGEYEVSFTVIDQITNRQTTRVATTTVPDPQTQNSFVTDIQLLGKQTGERNNQWFPITTYDVPGKIDSLKFIMRVNNNSDSVFLVESELIKFEADTSAAGPMFVNDNAPSDITSKGIDYYSRSTIESSSRKLIQPGGVTIEYVYPIFERGNYRFKVNAGDQKSLDLFKGRDFSVKSTDYPALSTARELALPLVYLMNEREYERILAIDDSDSLKQAVDKFWLKIAGNESDARSILRLYYERVEEANKLFSNFKEGWKTDRGMVYILFGTPYYSDEIRGILTWLYTYDSANLDYNFSFKKAHPVSEFYPFDHYRLQRKRYYYQRQYYQTQLWLTGAILVRKL